MGRRQGILRSIESHDGLEDAVSKMRELIDLAAKTLASGDEIWCASLLGEAGRRGVFEYARMMDSITEKNNKITGGDLFDRYEADEVAEA